MRAGRAALESLFGLRAALAQVRDDVLQLRDQSLGAFTIVRFE